MNIYTMPLGTLRTYLTKTKEITPYNIWNTNALYITVGEPLFKYDEEGDGAPNNVICIFSAAVDYLLDALYDHYNTEVCFIGSDDNDVSKSLAAFIVAYFEFKKSFKHA